ncbi:ABC transporter permease, partial [Mesorhizobium sp. M00.F.Ca.ET.158.01.1.1]
MNDFGLMTVFSLGPGGWGAAMSAATVMTIAVAVTGFVAGAIIGAFGAWAKISGGHIVRAVADGYTTILRGIPDLLVIYLFYFG